MGVGDDHLHGGEGDDLLEGGRGSDFSHMAALAVTFSALAAICWQMAFKILILSKTLRLKIALTFSGYLGAGGGEILRCRCRRSELLITLERRRHHPCTRRCKLLLLLSFRHWQVRSHNRF